MHWLSWAATQFRRWGGCRRSGREACALRDGAARNCIRDGVAHRDARRCATFIRGANDDLRIWKRPYVVAAWQRLRVLLHLWWKCFLALYHEIRRGVPGRVHLRRCDRSALAVVRR